MSPRALSDDIDVLILKQATEKQIVKADAYVAGQNFNHVFLENCTCFGFFIKSSYIKGHCWRFEVSWSPSLVSRPA